MTHRVLWGAVLLGVACAAWGFLPDEPKPVPKAVPKAVPKPLPKAAPKPQEAAPVVAPPAKAATERRPGEVFRDCSDCPEMVVVPAGSFDMGGSGSVESPVHRVMKAPCIASTSAASRWARPKSRKGNGVR